MDLIDIKIEILQLQKLNGPQLLRSFASAGLLQHEHFVEAFNSLGMAILLNTMTDSGNLIDKLIEKNIQGYGLATKQLRLTRDQEFEVIAAPSRPNLISPRAEIFALVEALDEFSNDEWGRALDIPQALESFKTWLEPQFAPK